MADPPKPPPKNLLKTMVMPPTQRGAQPSKAPVPPASTQTAPNPSSKPLAPSSQGGPVKPPPMWNYEGKEGARPGAAPAPAAAAAPSAAEVDAAKAAAAKEKQDAEDVAALLDTHKALAELSEQVALFEALVARLPE